MSIKQPIFVVGVPHSGTTLVGKLITQDSDIAYLDETNNIWMWGNANRADDVLTEANLNPKISKHIQQKITAQLIQSGKSRICDKTPRNCLRLPFIHAIFPDAKFIHLIRDGRAVMRSLEHNFNPPKKVIFSEAKVRLKRVSIFELHLYFHRFGSLFKSLFGNSIGYWGARPPGWSQWIDHYSSYEIAAKQWVETIEIAIQSGRILPPENYLEIHYEKLVNSPYQEIRKITDFADISDSELIVEYSKQIINPDPFSKWRSILNSSTLAEVREIMEPTMNKLGYDWNQ